MSMNVILVKSGTIILPNGKEQKVEQTFSDLIQTKTNDSYDIVNQETIENQLKMYKSKVSEYFVDKITQEFESYDDEIGYAFGDKSVKFNEVIISAQTQLDEHISSIQEDINFALNDGFEVSFQII